MKARDAVVCWTEADEPEDSPFVATRGQVHVGVMPAAGEADWMAGYMNSTGGAHRAGLGSQTLTSGFSISTGSFTAIQVRTGRSDIRRSDGCSLAPRGTRSGGLSVELGCPGLP